MKIEVYTDRGKFYTVVKNEKIFFTDNNICFYSGVDVNRNYTGSNQITLPIRHIVNGFKVI